MFFWLSHFWLCSSFHFHLEPHRISAIIPFGKFLAKLGAAATVLPHFLFGARITLPQAPGSRAKLLGFWFVASALESTLTDRLTSVASKRLTRKLNPLDATLTKNRGRGWLLWLTRILARTPRVARSN